MSDARTRSGVFPPWVVFGWRADAGTLRRISPVLERLVVLADRVKCASTTGRECVPGQEEMCLACEIRDIRRELYAAVWKRDEETGEKSELGTS